MNERQSCDSDAGVPGIPDDSVLPRGGASVEVEFDVVALDAVAMATDEERLRALVLFVLAAERQVGDWAVTLVLTGDSHLRDLHARFMGIDENTDVMTFPFDPAQGTRGGEIVVSVERATEQGGDHGHTAAKEVEFLLVHGLLHLCGWDDLATGARDAMLARQTHLVAAFDRMTPAPGT